MSDQNNTIGTKVGNGVDSFFSRIKAAATALKGNPTPIVEPIFVKDILTKAEKAEIVVTLIKFKTATANLTEVRQSLRKFEVAIKDLQLSIDVHNQHLADLNNKEELYLEMKNLYLHKLPNNVNIANIDEELKRYQK